MSAGAARRQPGVLRHCSPQHALLGGWSHDGAAVATVVLLLLLLQVVYNNNRDLAYFILQCGARVRPWSWLQAQHLPEPLRQDRLLVTSAVLVT